MSDQSKSELTPTSDRQAAGKRPEIDVSKLPSLPPSGSMAWGRSRKSGRWRGVGCGCALLILIGAIFAAYQGLRTRVWSSYAEIRLGLERNILVEVGAEEKQRLLDNLKRFETEVAGADDPYPAIGRFVAVAREALVDFVVDPEEAGLLNRLLEEELTTAAAEDPTR